MNDMKENASRASSTSLAGQCVVVIGGASGIGFAVAAAALDEGARVVVASSQKANVQAASERLGGGATGLVVDVSDEASVAGFFEGLGPFDHLAFTAGDWGARMGEPARDLDLAAAQASIAVRFWGALAVAKYGCRTIAEGGSITLTGGMLAHRPMKGAPLATAIGGAIEHLARALAVDLAPVRVNAVCPGLVLTDRTKRLPEELLRTFTARLPLPRGAQPAEVAEAYLYLMRGGYTTGQVLRVDGGGSVV
jgi:NAD(P)-dependent dehydrogenase (short-subunit alcohol dehydrogenase family)